MDHPNPDQLARFLRGRLGEAEQSGLEAHIASCDACCQKLRAIPDDELLRRLRRTNANTPSKSRRASKAVSQWPPPHELLDHPRYQVGRFLGAGGMGVVFQAEHRLMERPVALKVIHRELTRDPRAVEQFRAEAKAAARLVHPNIVTAYDADQAGETHFLVMEFVDGISLDRLVKKRGPLDATHACNYVRQAAQGLQHALEGGMVHRDIKPHNLMLTRKGQIKILDFGLARLASASVRGTDAGTTADAPRNSDITGSQLVMGTPDYMAPEQARDFRQTDIRADIYALGCTLFFLLTGHAPFAQGSALSKILAHKNALRRGLREELPAVPDELHAILSKMLAIEPADRYQTPAEVAKALTPLSRPNPPAAPTPKRTDRKTESRQPLVQRSIPQVGSSGSRSAAARTFLSQCGYCPARIRIPVSALGASVLCPKCGNYFTAVPIFLKESERSRHS